jgi:hypothetical protein
MVALHHPGILRGGLVLRLGQDLPVDLAGVLVGLFGRRPLAFGEPRRLLLPAHVDGAQAPDGAGLRAPDRLAADQDEDRVRV